MSYQFCPSSNKNIDRLIEKPITHYLSALEHHFSKFYALDVEQGKQGGGGVGGGGEGGGGGGDR